MTVLRIEYPNTGRMDMDDLKHGGASRESPGAQANRVPLTAREDREAIALPYPMSEDFLAERFAERWYGRLRYVHTLRRWYYWEGKTWREDATNLHCQHAILLVRAACDWPEAKELTPQERRVLDSKRTAWALLWLARSDRRIAATAEQVGVEPPVRWRRKKPVTANKEGNSA